MNSGPLTRPLRWFFVAWMSLVYVWGLSSLCGLNEKTLYLIEHCEGLGLPQNPCTVSGFFALLNGDPRAVAAFTAMLALDGALLWLGMSGAIPRRAQWLSVLAQAILVVAIGVIVHQQSVTLSLYLAFVLGSIGLPHPRRAVAAAVVGAAVLAVLDGNVRLWSDWRMLFVGTDYSALALFIAGYIALYAEQARAHAGLAAAHETLAETHAILATAHHDLSASAARIEELTQQAERQRLARDLHDTLAQGLAGVLMQLQVAEARLTTARYDRAQEALRQATAQARAALSEARLAIDDLRAADMAPRPLRQSIQEEMRRCAAAGGLICAGELDALAMLPYESHDTILCCVREALANVVRHACAQHAWVRATLDAGALILEIGDDGMGFNLADVEGQTGHYGLLGLRERARLAAGSLEIESAPLAGTTLRLRLSCRAGDEYPAKDFVAGVVQRQAP